MDQGLMELATIPAESVGAAVERLGVAAIVVIACYYLVKYFMGQLDKANVRNDDLSDRFIKATETMTLAVQGFTHALEKLSVAVDNLQERRTHQRP